VQGGIYLVYKLFKVAKNSLCPYCKKWDGELFVFALDEPPARELHEQGEGKCTFCIIDTLLHHRWEINIPFGSVQSFQSCSECGEQAHLLLYWYEPTPILVQNEYYLCNECRTPIETYLSNERLSYELFLVKTGDLLVEKTFRTLQDTIYTINITPKELWHIELSITKGQVTTSFEFTRKTYIEAMMLSSSMIHIIDSDVRALEQFISNQI